MDGTKGVFNTRAVGLSGTDLVDLQICGTQRSMIDKFDVKKRAYIGNTSMEVRLASANASAACRLTDEPMNRPKYRY